jgi:hypothetical protein
MNIESYCRIVAGKVVLNGEVIFETEANPFVISGFLTSVYNCLNIDYRKFFKMDALSKLGFLSSEMLLMADTRGRDVPKEDMSIITFNRSASLEADSKYQKTIQDYPSPAEFVYTLPNIVTGEISIRNKIYGETFSYITSEFQEEVICRIIEDAFRQSAISSLLAGWLEVDIFNNSLSGLMILCNKQENDKNYISLSPENLKSIFINI